MSTPSHLDSTDPGARRQVQARSWAWIQSFAKLLSSFGVTPNTISVFSIVFSLLVPLALFALPLSHPITWLLALAGVIGRLLCNVLDGLCAVEGARQTPLGALYNELPDRISDTIILVAAAGAAGAWSLGWATACFAALTAYVRTFGAALGAPHFFLGPMAKQQRMALMCALFVFTFFVTLAPQHVLQPGTPSGMHPVAVTYLWSTLTAFWILLIGCVITLIRRTLAVAAHLQHAAVSHTQPVPIDGHSDNTLHPHAPTDSPTDSHTQEPSLRRTVWQTIALSILCRIVRLSVGAHRAGVLPTQTQKIIFFANHTSHLDTLTLISALPFSHRRHVRPVAAKDYWDRPGIRRFIARHILHVVFIERTSGKGSGALDPLRQALEQGYSLIFFPEGTRHQGTFPQPFRSGLYHLFEEFKDQGVCLTPVYLENLQRIFPKGALVPLPLLNTVHFGGTWSPDTSTMNPASFNLAPTDNTAPSVDKAAFLAQAHAQVCELIPPAARQAHDAPTSALPPTPVSNTQTPPV